MIDYIVRRPDYFQKKKRAKRITVGQIQYVSSNVWNDSLRSSHWCVHVEDCKALGLNYEFILQVWEDLVSSNQLKGEIKKDERYSWSAW